MGLRAPGGWELGNILNIYVNTKTNTTSGAVSRVLSSKAESVYGGGGRQRQKFFPRTFKQKSSKDDKPCK